MYEETIALLSTTSTFLLVRGSSPTQRPKNWTGFRLLTQPRWPRSVSDLDLCRTKWHPFCRVERPAWNGVSPRLSFWNISLEPPADPPASQAKPHCFLR